MDEKQFLDLAESELASLESRIEQTLDAAGIDYDVKPQAGILELEFSNGSKIIVNRHTAAREIWVAARSGGFHFRHNGDHWCDTRNQESLRKTLSTLISQQCGASIQLTDEP